MSTETENQENSAEEQSWGIPPGHRVYGYHHGEPPPDLMKPWHFDPKSHPAPMPTQQTATAPSPGPSNPAPPPRQLPPNQPPPPQQASGAPQQDAWREQATEPAPAFDSRWLPPPLGPALTPTERMEQLQQLGAIPPHPGDREQQ
ncbi:MAG: hypothetical protein JJU11_02055 [Candidatus Sumerlaeia bacterium]|nr:hypothetical protein [Candidatus Sumerlaeia bacterium]